MSQVMTVKADHLKATTGPSDSGSKWQILNMPKEMVVKYQSVSESFLVLIETQISSIMSARNSFSGAHRVGGASGNLRFVKHPT